MIPSFREIWLRFGRIMKWASHWRIASAGTQEKGGRVFAAALASASKVFGSELGQRVAYYMTELLGQYGQIARSRLGPDGRRAPETYQFCPAQNIFAGSSEVQRNLVAWVGLGLPRFK